MLGRPEPTPLLVRVLAALAWPLVRLLVLRPAERRRAQRELEIREALERERRRGR